jgi:short subunit dehydrogenase-like uncharacterized protein
MPTSSRDFDLLLWGATGFTGRLTAEYLARGAARGIRWAIAGRDRARLDAIVAELPLADGVAAPAVVTASLDDTASLRAMAARTRVLVSTVGPYALHGSGTVAACVDEGTDYCDLTGEVQWIRRMIDAHHERAAAAGTKIVHCCGFDSIPSDIGTLVLQEEARARLGAPLPSVTLYVASMKGGASGGTIASMLNVLAEAGDRDVRRVLGHPYSLCPGRERRGPDGSDLMTARWDAAERAWVGPFVMASVNARVVRRSAWVLGEPWGAEFSYDEVSRFGAGAAGWLRAAGTSAGLGGAVVAGSIGPLRELARRTVLPKPGDGPTREQREAGRFRMQLSGRDSGGQERLRLEVRGTLDPGYGATAVMLAESGLALACDRASLPERGGVLTPASGIGLRLRERLDATGIVTFSVCA